MKMPPYSGLAARGLALVATGCTVTTTRYFACGDGNRIDEVLVCDGIFQCPNGADEAVAGCGTPIFACGGNEWIPGSRVCDGLENCANGADEASCTVYF